MTLQITPWLLNNIITSRIKKNILNLPDIEGKTIQYDYDEEKKTLYLKWELGKYTVEKIGTKGYLAYLQGSKIIGCEFKIDLQKVINRVCIYDMNRCPDCGKVFREPRKAGDYCPGVDWHGCESIVHTTKSGKLVWWNDNRG